LFRPEQIDSRNGTFVFYADKQFAAIRIRKGNQCFADVLCY